MKQIMTDWLDGISLANAEIRREIMIFPFGDFQHPTYGKLKFDEKFFNEIIDNFNNKVLMTEPFIDQQHDENKALAWLKKPPFIRQGMGLFIQPEWTDLGKQLLQGKIYKYFSPSWGPYKNPETGETYKNVLKGGAATNIPFLKMMPAMVDENVRMSEETVDVKLSDLTLYSSSGEADKADEPKEQTQDIVEKTSKEEKLMKDKLVKTLNLAEDASDEAILQGVIDVIEKHKNIEKELNGLKEKLNADKDLSVQVEEMKKQLTEKNCETALDKATKEGRLLPADREYWKGRFMADPDNVGKDLEKLPKVVDLDNEKGSGGEGEKGLKASDDPGQKLVDKANQLVAEKKAANFDEAVTIVCAEDKTLADAYAEKYCL